MALAGRYRILKSLGAGASGGVYLVEDRVLGGPPLALKRVEAASDPAFHDSLAREFAVLSTLSVPGVAAVHDLGLMPGENGAASVPFITRAFVDGVPLDRHAAHASLLDIVRVFARVLETVSALHRLGIVHGDIKPANVIVDVEGQPSVIDFGLSSRGGERDVLRGSGTPAFMAPELFRGQAPSRGADLYALGATLWTLVLGATPLEELSERALGAKLSGQLPTIPRDVTGDRRLLLQAALSAMADDPRERPKGADELLARIERALPAAFVGTDGIRPRAFVAPRIRGRDDVLRTLEASLVDPSAADGAVTVLHGPRGMGKSSVLRELKWRLELRGLRVVELRCAAAGLLPVAQLLRQACVFDERHAAESALIERVETGGCEKQEMIDAVVRVLSADDLSARVIVLVDDVDRAESLLSEALRLSVHSEAKAPPLVVATSESLDVAPVTTLGMDNTVALLPLTETEVGELTRDALGPVDDAALRALNVRSSGNPGVLVEALSSLHGREGITEQDVENLSLGTIGEALSRVRLAQRGDTARKVLAALSAAHGSLPASFVEGWLGKQAAQKAESELVSLGLLRREGKLLRDVDTSLAEWLRRDPSDNGAPSCARKILAEPKVEKLDVVTLATLALTASDPAGLKKWGKQAAQALLARGATSAAVRMGEVCLRHAEGEEALELSLLLADVCHAMGDYERVAAHARVVLSEEHVRPELVARARILAGRALVLAGRTDEGVETLRAIEDDAPRAIRVEALRELSRAHLRRGENERAKDAVDRGLLLADDREPARAELYAIDGMLFGMSGKHDLAHARFAEANALASQVGSLRDQAQVLGYAALGYEREGDLEHARIEYERCLAAARMAGDVALTATYAMNLGSVGFKLGLTEAADESYTHAVRLARRAGRISTALLAANNLANLRTHVGLFERARADAEHVLSEAQRLGLAFAAAHATHVLADIDARTRETESALAKYDSAASAFKQLGRSRERAEANMDAAQALLDRAGPSDASGAATKLAQARSLIDAHGLDDFRLRLRFLLARARAANGDVEGAERDLERCANDVKDAQDFDLLWQVHTARAQALRSLGSDMLAAKCAREAAEGVESLAARVPRDAREAFRADPRRRAAIELAESMAGGGAGRPALGVQTTAHVDRRFDRLLEIIKRLAREHDLTRLLERITDAAVELSGAERGFVLLVDDQGTLVPHTVRGTRAEADDPHVAFSRSIAESVLIDGEPMITVNARDDRRVNEFMSVHRLSLKSVAALPINGPNATLGVLYLEHRLRAGRFQESDMELLIAFADQAAIALENARLWVENETRRSELEAANRALSEAKDDIERLLLARTEELERVKTDLGRATAALEGIGKKHGIIGNSQGIRRVLALVERVQDSNVPVVIQGESGTGKELVARAIHFGGSRKKGPFIAVNCAALPETLLESELFGHVRGAFTGADRDKRGLFAQAHGGTLFLDEFADMPMRMQVDLLRVLQEGRIRPVGGEEDVHVDVRIIAASNRSLQKLLAERRLREDLYYRLSVVEIHLPALRERPEDVPLLCDHFLARISENAGGTKRRLSRAATERIVASGLPGNVRQLEHLLTSAAMMCDSAVIEAEDLPLDGPVSPRVQRRDSELPKVPAATLSAPQNDLPVDLETFKELEKQRILAALSEHGWNRAKAAKMLGMPRRTFYRRLEEYQIL